MENKRKTNHIPFPKGNQFWKLRSKHGRDRIFESPEIMWEAACEYFQWCEDNPLIEVDYRGKDATMVQIPKMRAFSIKGLCIFLDCGLAYFNQFEYSLKDKTDDLSLGFSKIISHIREVIFTQKFTGAAAGFLNASIIARDLGLVDHSDVTTKGKELPAATFNLGDMVTSFMTDAGDKEAENSTSGPDGSEV